MASLRIFLYYLSSSTHHVVVISQNPKSRKPCVLRFSATPYTNNVASPGYQTFVPSTRANSVITCGLRELLPSA